MTTGSGLRTTLLLEPLCLDSFRLDSLNPDSLCLVSLNLESLCLGSGLVDWRSFKERRPWSDEGEEEEDNL